MNELSWLIYAADVTGKIGATTGIVATIGGPGLAWLIFLSFCYSGDYSTVEQDKDDRKAFGKPLRYLIPVWFFVAIVAVLAPSKETVYAIAASEMGERVIASETAGKAVQALNAWLDRQIAPAAQ